MLPFIPCATPQPPYLLVTTKLLSLSVCRVLVYLPHVSEIIWCLSFSVWLISLHIIPSRSIHIVANRMVLSFFMAE